MNKENITNKAYVRGEIVSDPLFARKENGEDLFELFVRIPRLSGQADLLPVTISQTLIDQGNLAKGKILCAIGQLRSHSKLEQGKPRLTFTVLVKELTEEQTEKYGNSVRLSGYLCKPPVYRTTPFNREIADILIAVSRTNNKSDYVPCIAWGRNARFVKELAVGDRIAVSGRIQSREYQKKSGEDTKTMTTYEVSVGCVAVFHEEENFDIDYDFDIFESKNKAED